MQNQATPSFAIFDDYRPTVSIVVAIRWLLLLGWFFILHYRIEYDQTWFILQLMGAGLAALNAYMTWRIVTRRPIRWHYALTLSVADLAVITTALFLAGGLQNPYYIFYYPALLGLSLLFPGRSSYAVAAVVITLYIVIAFTVSPVLDLDETQERCLLSGSSLWWVSWLAAR